MCKYDILDCRKEQKCALHAFILQVHTYKTCLLFSFFTAAAILTNSLTVHLHLSVHMSNIATGTSVLFAQHFVDAVKEGRKTQTTRVWKNRAYDSLVAAAKKRLFIPATTNYAASSCFGYLMCWLVQPRALETINNHDLMREGLDSEQTPDEFVDEWFPNIPRDTCDVKKDDVDATVFVIRFIYKAAVAKDETVSAVQLEQKKGQCVVCHLPANNHTCVLCDGYYINHVNSITDHIHFIGLYMALTAPHTKEIKSLRSTCVTCAHTQTKQHKRRSTQR